MLQKFNFSRFMVNSVCFKDSSLRNFLETCLWLVGRSCSNLSGYERCLVGLILCAVRRKKNFTPVLHQRSIFWSFMQILKTPRCIQDVVARVVENLMTVPERTRVQIPLCLFGTEASAQMLISGSLIK